MKEVETQSMDASPGNSDGVRNFGGNPAGPIWSPDKAPIGPFTLSFQSIITSNPTKPVALTHAGDGTGQSFYHRTTRCY